MRDSFAEELTNIENAEQELKRIDHLIYVSLKYTRTVDVFKNVLQRLVTTGDFLRETLLDHLLTGGKIESIPENQAMKADLIRKNFTEDLTIMELINFHQLMRRINRAEFTRKNEFRRHVTMTIVDGPDVMEIKIETLTDYYKKMKDHFMAVNEIVRTDKEMD